MTRYRIVTRWGIFWIEQKFLWFWIRAGSSRDYHKTLHDARMRLEDIKRTRADKGRVVWVEPKYGY